MKKFVGGILAASVLSGSLLASSTQAFNPYDADFAKVNQYFNSLIESHMNASALNNFGYPRTNIQESADKIILEFDLAGIDKKDIKLSIDDQKILTLQGQRKESKEDKSKEYVKKEIFYGEFKKEIQLPENIDDSKLTTSFKNGILTITIPKIEVKKPKVKLIPIK